MWSARQQESIPGVPRWLRRPLVPTCAALLVWTINCTAVLYEPGGSCMQHEATPAVYMNALARP